MRTMILTRLRYIILCSSMKSVRFTIAVSSLIFAILLWWPGTLFTPARGTYRLMSEIADENVWGLVFFIHAIASLYTLLFNRYCRIGFVLDALLGAVVWTVATVACFASHWKYGTTYAPPAAMSAEVGVLLAAWWYLARWVARK